MGRTPAAGDVIAGKYRVERLLGRGGMGYVLAAWHLQLDEHVALKFLLPDALEMPAIVSRFRREGRAAAKIKSEHACRVLDVGMSEEHGPFLVMELLSGLDLGARVRQQGPLPINEAVHYLLQACHALAEAHSRGIVHRDLKPSNLFLTERPDGTPLVKLLDFGISKMVTGRPLDEQTITEGSMVLGSFAYMSPEQARNARDLDARADIWALGCILQKLISGKTPFEATTPTEYVAKIIGDPPMPVRAYFPRAPAELEAIILKCVEKEPGHRVASVAALAVALGPFAPEANALVESIVRLTAAGERVPTAPTLPLQPGAPIEPTMRDGGSWSAPSSIHTTPLEMMQTATTPMTGPQPVDGPAPGWTPLVQTNPSTAAAWSPATAPPPRRRSFALAIGIALGLITTSAVALVVYQSRPSQQDAPVAVEPAAVEPAAVDSVAVEASPSMEPSTAVVQPSARPSSPAAAQPSAAVRPPPVRQPPTKSNSGSDPFAYQ